MYDTNAYTWPLDYLAYDRNSGSIYVIFIVALLWLVYAREGGGECHEGLGIRIRGDRRTIEKDGIGGWGDWGNIYREMGSLTLTRARNLVIRAKSRMVYDSN